MGRKLISAHSVELNNEKKSTYFKGGINRSYVGQMGFEFPGAGPFLVD